MPFETEVRPDGARYARYISKRQRMGSEEAAQLVLGIVGPGMWVQASRLRERLQEVPRATYDAAPWPGSSPTGGWRASRRCQRAARALGATTGAELELARRSTAYA